MSNDPANLLSKHVKIHSVSAKPELNNKIGVAESYLTDRQRYLISLPPHISPSPIALKADNLSIPTFPEKARGKIDELWGMALTVYHDENVRALLRQTINNVESRLPPNVKLEQVAGGLLILLLGMIYFMGLSKTIMLISLVLMGVVVSLPDIIAKRDPKSILRNFPFRWKEAIEQNTGYRPTQKVATGILVGILLLSSKVLLTPRSSGARPLSAPENVPYGGSNSRPNNEGVSSFTVADIYKMGYDDATNVRVFGTSLPPNHESMSVKTSSFKYDYDDYADYGSYAPPAPKKSKIGIGTIMSLFALGRTAKELGFHDGRFDTNLFMANARNLPPMKLAFLGFMAYRVLSAFI